MQILLPDGTLAPGRTPPLDDARTVELYRAMVRIRLVDERMTTLQRQGRIGFYIGGTGEEAAILPPVAALRPDDWLFPCYREGGAYLLRGLPLQRFVDNLFGNARDPAKGRQMPNHIAWRERNIVSVSSPIGTQVVQAAGAARAAQILGRPDVMMTFFGEGATSSNDFHAGMTFAGVWKAPVVFVCRNNGWAISVPRDKQCAAAHIADKAAGYGMPGVRVDGNDPFAAFAASRDAVDRARRGEGPTLLEMETYRIAGHSTSDDPRAYRDEAEVELWRTRDPLSRTRRYLESRGAWSEAQEDALRKSVDEELRAATAAAETAPAPDPDSLFEDVYSRLPWHLAEQLEDARANRSDGAARCP